MILRIYGCWGEEHESHQRDIFRHPNKQQPIK